MTKKYNDKVNTCSQRERSGEKDRERKGGKEIHTCSNKKYSGGKLHRKTKAYKKHVVFQNCSNVCARRLF